MALRWMLPHRGCSQFHDFLLSLDGARDWNTPELYDNLIKQYAELGAELTKLGNAFTARDAGHLLRHHAYLRPIIFQYAFAVGEVLSQLISNRVWKQQQTVGDGIILLEQRTLFEWWTPGMEWGHHTSCIVLTPDFKAYLKLCVSELSVPLLDAFWKRFPGNRDAVFGLLRDEYFNNCPYSVQRRKRKLFRRMLYTARGKNMHRWLVEHGILEENHFRTKDIPHFSKRWWRHRGTTRHYRYNASKIR